MTQQYCPPRPIAHAVLRVALASLLLSPGACLKKQAKPKVAPVQSQAEVIDLDGGVSAAELEITLGNPGAAKRILVRVPKGDPSYDYAQELLALAESELDALVQAQLRSVEALMASQKFAKARRKLGQLEQQEPLTDAQKEAVAERRAALKAAREEAQAELDKAREEVREHLLKDELRPALRALREMRYVVWEVSATEALRWERTLYAIENRYKEAVAKGDESPMVARKKKRAKRVSRSSKRGGSEAGTTEAPEDDKASAEQQEAEEILTKARAARDRGAFFEAISLYLKAKPTAWGNKEATKALRALEGERQRLVGEYLQSANQHFLRQELALAAPYYKKVLQIEPSNKRAAEGIRMYQNLEKIRRKKGR